MLENNVFQKAPWTIYPLRSIQSDLNADLLRFKNSGKVTRQDALDRDLLLYLLWQQGHQTNSQIGERFDLTYFSVSRRISMFEQLILRDKQVAKRLEHTKSKINGLLPK